MKRVLSTFLFLPLIKRNILSSIYAIIMVGFMLMFINGCIPEKVPEIVPFLTTSDLSDITISSASCGGNITSDGGGVVIARGVCWSTSHNPTLSNDYSTDGNGTGTFSSSITGLTANTQYYVRAYATNNAGTAYGHEISFTTLPLLPIMTTLDVTAINGTTASCGGDVTDDGGGAVIARGVCWGTNPNPTIDNNHSTNGVGLGSFSSAITGLTQGTIYYVRAYATNSAGTSYGNELNVMIDIEGNVYNTVTIGTQVWMKQNLKTIHYANGTAIPLVTANIWIALTETSKAYSWYDDDIDNKATSGALYTWAAAMDGAGSSTANPSSVQGVCPTGWHLPSYLEWIQMVYYLADNGYNYDGTTGGGFAKIAKSLAASSGWTISSVPGAVGNTDYPTYRNKSGFTALPGGCGYDFFYGTGTVGWWRCATDDNGGILDFSIDFSISAIGFGDNMKAMGTSVRCIKD